MSILQQCALIGVFTLVGCAHSTMRGSVAMKINENEAHVCMGDKEVKVGDSVSLFKNVCLPVKAGGEGGCRKENLGRGEVIRVLNEHYSVVKVRSGVPFQEGTLVEKDG